MSTYADQLYWQDVGLDDLEDVVDDVKIEVFIVAETGQGYYVNNVQSRKGSHFLDTRFVAGSIQYLLGGQSIIEVQRSWVNARGLQHWIEREFEIDDYDIIERPRLEEEPVRERGPDEEPF